jgi:hypothetical protein
MKYFLIYFNIQFPAQMKWNNDEEQYKVEHYKSINSVHEWKCECFPNKKQLFDNLKNQNKSNFKIGNHNESAKSFMFENTNYGISNIVEISENEYNEFIK